MLLLNEQKSSVCLDYYCNAYSITENFKIFLVHSVHI
jgi:hypothetical protein